MKREGRIIMLKRDHRVSLESASVQSQLLFSTSCLDFPPTCSTTQFGHVAVTADWSITATLYLRVMPRSSRRYKPLHQSNGSGSIPGCDPVRMPRARLLLFCLLALLVLALVLGVYLSDDTSSGHVNRMPVADLTKDRVRVVRDKHTDSKTCLFGP